MHPPLPAADQRKVERFNRSLATERAYAQSYSSETERAQAYSKGLHYCNYHRPHFGIGGATPISRVHNDLRNYHLAVELQDSACRGKHFLSG